MKREPMTPYARAIDAWRNTDEYRTASDPSTLRAQDVKFMMNRLEAAFAAGWRAGLVCDSDKSELPERQQPT